MNIYTVKRIHKEHFPGSHFFDRANMKFAGQTLKMYHVRKQGAKYEITAPLNYKGKRIGTTYRIFDPISGTLS